MRLFDSHCHLQDDRLALGIEAALERAATAGVGGMACCGSSEADWAAVRRLASKHPEIVPAYGLHPWFVSERTGAWFDTLRDFLRDPDSVVGEIGIDHAIKGEDLDDQERVFIQQLELARELNRPATVHCRRGWGRLLEILGRTGGFAPGVLIHSYSGSAELVPQLCALGAFFSFSGSITHDRNLRGRKSVPAVPDDRLMIETDAPDLMPAIPAAVPPGAAAGEPGERGNARVNEPANLVHVVRVVAELRGASVERVASIAWANSCRFFRRVTTDGTPGDWRGSVVV